MAKATNPRKSKPRQANGGAPRRRNGFRLCLVVHPDGVKIYGNSIAFRQLEKWMSFISKAPSDSYRELHTAFHLRTTSEDGEKNSRVVVLFDPAIAPAFANADEFDLNFMVVEKKDLDRLEAWEDGGMVPPGWVGGEGS